MAFYLYVWHESEPISGADAVAKLNAGDEAFAPNPAVAACYDDILSRFPALETFDGVDESPDAVWSFAPDRSDSLLVLACIWPKADEVADAVRGLAARHGLVCFEPGRGIYPSAPDHHPTAPAPVPEPAAAGRCPACGGVFSDLPVLQLTRGADGGTDRVEFRKCLSCASVAQRGPKDVEWRPADDDALPALPGFPGF